MYNAGEKLRSGEALSDREREVHELAACGVLRDLHDELDTAVGDAYGWEWPLPEEEVLDRMVRLHDERAAEEAAGVVCWLRPEYQAERFGADLASQTDALPAEAKGRSPTGSSRVNTARMAARSGFTRPSGSTPSVRERLRRSSSGGSWGFTSGAGSCLKRTPRTCSRGGGRAASASTGRCASRLMTEPGSSAC